MDMNSIDSDELNSFAGREDLTKIATPPPRDDLSNLKIENPWGTSSLSKIESLSQVSVIRNIS